MTVLILLLLAPGPLLCHRLEVVPNVGPVFRVLLQEGSGAHSTVCPVRELGLALVKSYSYMIGAQTREWSLVLRFRAWFSPSSWRVSWHSLSDLHLHPHLQELRICTFNPTCTMRRTSKEDWPDFVRRKLLWCPICICIQTSSALCERRTTKRVWMPWLLLWKADSCEDVLKSVSSISSPSALIEEDCRECGFMWRRRSASPSHLRSTPVIRWWCSMWNDF